MSARNKQIFANVMTFAGLLLSWWMISLFVSSSAIAMDGKYFDPSFPVVGGFQYNDWLPVFAAGAFGLGWIIAIWAATFVKREWQVVPFLIFAAMVPGLLGFVVRLALKDIPDPIGSELLNTCITLFVNGSFLGAAIGAARRMEKDIRGLGDVPSPVRPSST